MLFTVGIYNVTLTTMTHSRRCSFQRCALLSPLSKSMKAMRTLPFVLLAAILFLELGRELVLFGSIFAPRTACFFGSRSEHSDHSRLSYESCIVKIGICRICNPVACCYLHWS